MKLADILFAEDKFNAANQCLSEAEKLNLDPYEPTFSADIQDARLKISWAEQRESVNKFCINIDSMLQDPATDYKSAIKLINECESLYKKHAKFLTLGDKAVRLRLSGLLKKAHNLLAVQKDLDTQKSINQLIQNTSILMDNGALPAALANLQQARQLAATLSGSENVPVRAYNNPNFFSESIRYLEPEVSRMKTRFESRIKATISDIVTVALLDKHISVNNSFDTTPLYQLLHKKLWRNWHKFDRKDMPNKVLDEMSDLISRQIKPTNFFVRTIYWTYDGLYIPSPDELEQRLDVVLDRFTPDRQVHNIKLPIFSQAAAPVEAKDTKKTYVKVKVVNKL